ncbi:MAG: hypothetical protein ACRDNE_02320 [Gaiellaceae bacterium]
MAPTPDGPDEDLPQDPGTSGLPSGDEEPDGSLEAPEGEDEVTGTDAAGRKPRHRRSR